jgi:hypothetical protein
MTENRKLLLALGAILIAVPVLVVIAMSAAKSEAPLGDGKVEVTGGPLGAFAFAPRGCQPGGAWVGGGFFGVALPDASGTKVIRVARDPGGRYSIVLGTRPAPGQSWQEVTLEASQCRHHAAEFRHRKPWHGGKVSRRYYGSADFDCPLPGGGTASGRVKFEDCR